MIDLKIENNLYFRLIINTNNISQVERIKGFFTYQNPNYFMLKKKNRWLDDSYKTNELFKPTDKVNEILIHRGLLTHLMTIFPNNNINMKKHFNLSDVVDVINKEKIFETNHWQILKDNYLADFMTERYYQTEPLSKFIFRKQGINVTGTGAGKTPFLYYICRLIQDHYETVNNILIIAPVLSLVTQIPKQFINYTRDDQKEEITSRCKMLGGKQHTFKKLKLNDDKNILIAGYQALTRRDDKFFEQFDCVIIDEAHKAPCNSIEKIYDKCINLNYAIGLTATMKKGYDGLVINGMFGDVLYEKKEGELVDEGFLSQLDIYFINWQYENSLQKKKLICGSKCNYDNEMYIIKHSYEKMKIYDYIFNNYITREKENTVVLFKNLDTLYFVYMYLKTNFPEYNYIPIHASQSMGVDSDGKYKNDRMQDLIGFLKNKANLHFDKNIINDVIDSLKTVKTEKRDDDLNICRESVGNVILAIRSCIDTGVDVDNLHNAITGQDVDSEQAFIQGIGRIVRPQDGKNAQYFDICDDFSYIGSRGGFNTNTAYDHKKHRMEYCKEHGYDIKELTVNIDDI